MTFSFFFQHIWQTILNHRQELIAVVGVLFVLHFLFKFLKRAYHMRINDKFIAKLKWKIYEIKFPRENLKTPKAMEQVFAAMHGYFTYGLTPWQKWIDGKVEVWTSFEIAATKRGTRFFVRFEADNKNIVEAGFFSQYPDIELTEVEDYTHEFPHDLPNDKYDLFASDLIFKGAHQSMPIKTYLTFESPVDEQRLDPISTLVEGFSNLKGEEAILIQLVIRPTGDAFNWYKHIREESEELINKMSGRTPQHAGPGIMGHMMLFIKNLLLSPFQAPTWAGHGEEQKFPIFRVVAPHETDIMKAIGEKMAQTPFEAIVRFVTVDLKQNKGSVQRLMSTIFGSFTQFNTKNLNAFGPGPGTMTFKHKVAYNRYLDLFFRGTRLERRKKKMWHAYHERDMSTLDHWYHKFGHLKLETCLLSPSELATIFHPPGLPVTSRQSLGYMSAKKVGPPPNLPILEE